MRAPNSFLSGDRESDSLPIPQCQCLQNKLRQYLIKHIRTLNGNARIFTNAITIIYEACGSVRFGEP